MTIKKFHIYLADLNPHYGTEPGKVRPVVVIQTDLLNNIHPSTLICPTTTTLVKESSILRVHLSKKETHICKKDSDILVDQIRAIDNRRLIKEIGQLTKGLRHLLLENLRILVLE